MRAQGYEPGADLAQRVRTGGWIEKEIKSQRGDGGSLHRWHFADTGAASHFGRFVPLVDLGTGSRVFDNLGALGLLSLVCHGPGDLLGMTDAGFHFQALGVGDDVASLRQFVVLPFDGDGARGHAALLDRQLAGGRSQERCRRRRRRAASLAYRRPRCPYCFSGTDRLRHCAACCSSGHAS
jgi:hypothetical protein